MALALCLGPANLELELRGYEPETEALAQRFFERFKKLPGRDNWRGVLVATGVSAPHLGGCTLELGPVSPGGVLEYPELPGRPLRHGAPRSILHGVMALTAHFLRQRSERLLHAAGRHLPGYGAVVAIGASGAGKSTLTSALGGREMGDEGIVLGWREGTLYAQPCLVPGERLPEFWDAHPLAALLIPARADQTTVTRLHGHEALIAAANAAVRLRGDDLFDDLDWTHRALKQVPVFRVGWALTQSPIEELKRALDAAG